MTQRNPNSPLTKATLLSASALTVMAGATIAPSLPAMQDYFAEVGSVELLVKLVLTIPALFIVIGSPIAGLIVDLLIYLFAWLLIPLIIFFIYEPHRINSNKSSASNNELSNNASIPVNVLILVYGMTALSQIIFYMIPVQLPFYKITFVIYYNCVQLDRHKLTSSMFSLLLMRMMSS